MSGIDRDTIRESLWNAIDGEGAAPGLMRSQADALAPMVEALIRQAEQRAARQARYDALTEAAKAIEAEIGPLTEVDTFAGGYDCCGCSTYRDIVDHAKRLVCSLRDQEGA